jgi:putative transcriptional regulator
MTHANSNIGAVQEALGARLRDARLNLNLTREDLAADVGLSVDTVRNAETGRNVSLETLIRLLRGLGRVDDLERLLESGGPSPVQLAKRQGKIRQRASGSRTTKKSGRWQW